MKKLLTTLLALAGLAIGGLAAVYFLAPETAVHWAVAAERARAGLTEHQIRIGEFNIHYLDGGRGEPLLLLHGFGADKDNWTRVAAHLTDDYRVIAPDLPGFGESSHPMDADYGIAVQVERLHAFVQALELPAVHLGGNSMGGDIAGMYGAAHPAAVRSLWLLDPGGVASAEPSEYFRRLESGQGNPLIIQNVAQFDQLLDFVAAEPPFIPGAMKRVLAERAVARRDLLAKIFGQIRQQKIPLEEALAHSPIPTLIVWGKQDRVLDPSGARVLADVMPNARVALMDDTGHIPMLEHPAAVAEDFETFQRGLQSAHGTR